MIHPFKLVSLALLVATVAPLNAAASGKPGEKWIYTVDGIRPMSNPPVDVDGDRVDEILSVTGEGAALRMRVKSTWGKDDQNPSLATLDNELRVHQVEVGSMMTIAFKPPVPTVWSELAVGQNQVFETQLSVMGFDMPLKYEVKRLDDETITVPAGKFENCRHIQMVVHATDPSGQPSKTRYDHWIDAKGQSLIKEITVTNFQSDNSQRTICELKEHRAP